MTSWSREIRTNMCAQIFSHQQTSPEFLREVLRRRCRQAPHALDLDRFWILQHSGYEVVLCDMTG